jgi:hypothetical protein
VKLQRRHSRRHDGRARADWLATLSAELDRSRRYERSFALIRVPRAASRGRGEEEVGRLASALRGVDRCWSADGSVWFLLPESTRTAGEGFLTRMRAAFPDLLLDEARMACFPEDALTGGALLDAVRPRHSAVPPPARTAAGAARAPRPAAQPADASSGS